MQPQDFLPEGPLTGYADGALALVNDYAGVLVKRTTAGWAVATAADVASGVVYSNTAAGREVAVWPLKGRIPLVAAGACAIGGFGKTAALGKIQNDATGPAAPLKGTFDTVAAADGDIVWVLFS